MNYNFTGKLTMSSLDSAHPYLRRGKTKAGDDYLSLNVSVASSKNNRGYVELFGMKRQTIQTMDTENKKIEVSWSDRFDEDVLKNVARYKKFTVKIGELRKEFLTEWDMIEFIRDHEQELNGKKVTITGRTTKNIYNGTAGTRFVMQNLYTVDDDVKEKMTVSTPLFWTADDVDTADWKSDKKLIINGFTSDYVSDKDLGLKGNYYFGQSVVFDASKIDYSNGKHVSLKDFKLKQLGLTEENGKIVVGLKKKKVYTLGLIMNYVNGAEEVPFDESTLTANQRSAIELGLKTIDDFKPSGSIYGERIVEYKVVDFDLRGDGEDGVYESDVDLDDFEEKKFVPQAKESIEDVLAATDGLDEDEDLFG